MSSVTTLTLFRFPGLFAKTWGFVQMQFAHSSLGKTLGLTFYKLMGSGRELGFSPLPDWGVYALLCVWENEQAADDFFANSEIFRRYKAHSNEQWTIFMKSRQSKGFWSGSNPFVESVDLDAANPLIAVVTRATIRTSKLLKFWNFVPISQQPIKQGCPGLIYTKGIGEAPLVQMATFSIWENMESLKSFAYNSLEHQEAIKKTRQLDWYKEELFARFQPYRSVGTWGGIDLLAPFLSH